MKLQEPQPGPESMMQALYTQQALGRSEGSTHLGSKGSGVQRPSFGRSRPPLGAIQMSCPPWCSACGLSERA